MKLLFKTLSNLGKRLLKTNAVKGIYFVYLVIIHPLKRPYKWLFKQYILWLLERKVTKAVCLSKIENRRYIVTTFFGRPRYFTKQSLKLAIKKRKFKKGVTIQDIEKSAYFVTN